MKRVFCIIFFMLLMLSSSYGAIICEIDYDNKTFSLYTTVDIETISLEVQAVDTSFNKVIQTGNAKTIIGFDDFVIIGGDILSGDYLIEDIGFYDFDGSIDIINDRGSRIDGIYYSPETYFESFGLPEPSTVIVLLSGLLMLNLTKRK